MQPLRLPQFEDLAVVESVDFVLEQLQGGGLAGQRPGDLLSHHLHHLDGDVQLYGYVQAQQRKSSSCRLNAATKLLSLYVPTRVNI